MTSTAEVIVLSSSPVPQSKTPSRPPGNPDKLRSISPPATTPPPVISTSDPVQLPSRSRFFANKPVTDKGAKKKKTTTKKSTAQDPDGKDASSKPRKRGKKEAKEPEPTALENIGLESLDSSHDTTKKTAGSEKNRKRKTSKSKETGNMTLAGKVTKASGDSQAKKSKTGKKGASAPAEETEEKESNVLEKDEELHLQGAMRRRLDWTPPRETVPADATTTESDGHYAKQPNSPSMGGFGKLLSDFNYAGSASESRTIPLNTDGAGPTKRRRIELVDANLQPQPNKSDSNDESSAQGEGSSACAKPKKKSKAPKRLTTLTARMTAQYARDDESDDVTNELTQQFGKPKSRRGKTKTAETDTVFTVLSPEAAANSLNDQDLVFGTCSQLEREDSPQTLREMQQAITASESIPEERTQSSIFGSQKTKAAELSSARSVSRLTGTRNLWSVAARDTEGSLARAKDLDVCDLTGASEVSQKQDDNASRSKSLLDDDWFELDYGKPGPSKRTTSLSEKIANPTINKQPPARPEEASCTKDVQVEPTSTAQVPPQQPSMPQYSGFTDADLSRQVVSYGFKSVRGRKKMIELLQKCWESKHGSSDKPLGSQSQSQPENARSDATIQSQAHDVPAQAAAPSRKPKPKVQANHSQKTGTTTEEATVSPTMPKKSAQKAKILEPLPSVSSFIDVEEIQDSQDEITPPSSQPGQKPSKEVHVPPSSFIDIEEIQDSEDEVTPSPSRVQKRYTEIFSNASSSIREPSLDIFTKPMSPSPKKSKPAAHKSSHAGKTTAPASPTKSKQQSSKRSSLPGISTQITKAVRGQSHASANPSMGGRSHPTWHEKMLMYDPIILEDFTTWLNVEGLGLVGEDREVNTTDVREWCESKGICCCWKNSATW